MSIDFSFNKTQLFPFFAALFAFSIPFKELQVVLIALLVISWLVEGNLKEKWNLFIQSKAALLFVVFYLLHLVWFFNTSNFDYALKDIQTKATLLLFPIIFAHAIVRDILFFKKISKAFVLGNIAAALICLVYASVNCLNDVACNFTYTAFSIFLHPTYFSILISTSIVLIFFQFDYFKTQFSRVGIVFILMFFVAIIFMLLSKMGIIAFFALVFWLLIVYAIKTKRIKMAVFSVIILAAVGIAAVLFIPQINNRFKAIVKVESGAKIDITTTESTAVRKLIWENAVEIIDQNFWLGTGTGDVKDELLQSYQKRGMTGAFKNKLNAHNQYFQSVITFGFVGLVYFIFLLIYMIFKVLKYKNFIYFSFFIVIALNFIAESALETEAGAISIAFLNSFLFFKPKE